MDAGARPFERPSPKEARVRAMKTAAEMIAEERRQASAWIRRVVDDRLHERATSEDGLLGSDGHAGIWKAINELKGKVIEVRSILLVLVPLNIAIFAKLFFD